MWQQLKQKYIKRPIRKVARRLLGFVSRATILKHHPTVITLVGSGPTSIIREAVYFAIKEAYPARRNIELPEAEFSIPLTVLGYKIYPDNYHTWLWYLIKAYVQLVTVKPFKHALVLELNPSSQTIMNYWLSILRPEVMLQIGQTNFSINPTDYGFHKHYKIGTDSPDAYIHVATEVGNFLEIDSLDIELGLSSMRFPEARLRILPGKNDSLIIDSTHYYFPMKLNSVLETIDTENRRLIAFTPFELDQKLLTEKQWLINPINYTPVKNDLVLIRGRRSELINKQGHLISALKGNV